MIAAVSFFWLLQKWLEPQALKFKDSNPVTVCCTPNFNKTHFYYKAVGFSMVPTIKDNFIIECIKVNFNELKVGDIVNYKPQWNNYKLTCHRLVMKDKYGFIASGDNNMYSESFERITEDNYVNKVIVIYVTNNFSS